MVSVLVLLSHADKLAQRHKAVRQMYILDRNTESLQMQILAREVPQAADAALDQTARDRRRVAAPKTTTLRT